MTALSSSLVSSIVDGAVVEEYETLIQPGRDPGPVHVHGITPEMLQSAPRFEEVAGDIATRLDGAVLVAHNISFDVRMLCQEAARLDRIWIRSRGGDVHLDRLTNQTAGARRSGGWPVGTESHRARRRPYGRRAH